jgi:hypothetical protein
MKATVSERRYRPTESKYKGGANEMYVTYDLEQKTRGDGSALYPKVKRVYIAGQVLDWKVGVVKKKSGREVYGVQINYKQSRKSYHRKGYTAQRGKTTYETSPASIGATSQKFAQVIEVPEDAGNVRFYINLGELPATYRHALQRVR